MTVDARQILGGVVTFTMFAMLGNMIKKDHLDSVEVRLPEASAVQFDAIKVTEQSLVTLPRVSKGPWKEEDGTELKPCWTRPESEVEQSKGFITFSLTNGPEYHVSQIADAVVVARYLGATLVLPDIRGSKPGDTRHFQEIYDVEKFVKGLDGVVEVAKDQPAEISTRKLGVVRVPNRVTKGYIAQHIEPIFREKGNLRLATYFPSVNMRKTKGNMDLDSISCLATFGTLELQPEVHEVVDSMVERLRTLSRKSNGQFIAVDLRVDILEKKGCQGSGTQKSCYSPHEIGTFLRKIGFTIDTTIYVTQSTWHSSLDALKEIFPKTYTKESIMPAEKKDKFLNSESSEFAKALDFYICSQSDVFVPAISGLFYANVAGKRIASGKTQILVPDQLATTAPASNFLSFYVSKKNHFVYSCFC
ncbi:GDP-fucose protein O-fucosyltransferase [Macleaya cordata]|uniref:O-fucosyltransferase family protein n=1 Tax=Macleaya cordata TaxID=56857 RepID=A0A200QAI7_MACCD|nr:GDP-fucose protein O-fucosyltransferase [Macleaya cordata]